MATSFDSPPATLTLPAPAVAPTAPAPTAPAPAATPGPGRPARARGASPYDPQGAYDGTGAFLAAGGPTPPPSRVQVAVTLALVAGPIAGVGLAVLLAWGHGVGWLDLALLAVLYTITGLGISVGYHRGLTHRGFTAVPALRVALAVAGAMAFEGDPISWVSTHRRHHAYTDRPGDPHSPYRYGTGTMALLRGLFDAHLGWLFRNDPTPPERWAPDLLDEPAMHRVSRLFPLLSVVSLAIPFGIGWAVTGTLAGALLALLWGGLVRAALLQHVTWSVNSLCHVLGDRPFTTRSHDRATNLWPLAVPSFGEAWHNAHHADPTCARHGMAPGQVDIAAEVIRLMEHAGWVRDVHWPTPERVAELRRTAHPARPAPTGSRTGR